MKVYKHNNKLTVYIPFEVANELGINDNDEVDFFKYNEKAYLFAKKSEIANMLAGSKSIQKEHPQNESEISNEEVSVLKKLDSFRYLERSIESVDKILNSYEKSLLNKLIRKKAVSIFRKDSKELYSISRDIYNRFLMRNKLQIQTQKGVQKQTKSAPVEEKKEVTLQSKLESEGYLVLHTEAEAANVSRELENEIRHGLILGTRAFNKKFYIITRQYFNKHSPGILNLLKSKESKVSDIAKSENISEDATRAILYLLSENGDIKESKKDSFVVA
jgi:bifunctional DNA-binding transcriptional regulator/antitoxin component of YhaV-PrlF toxin-antitoxin module